MKILLTGGAGFIGSHTCVELVSAGHQPVIVDNFYNASPKVLDRLKTITGQDIPFYEADVSDEKAMNAIFEKERFDAVIHFAGYKAVGESVSKPLEYYRNNLDTTLTLCECMRRYGVKRIVFSSSATVYGLCEEVPFREDMRSMGCTNPYGWTKYMIEQILKDVAFANPDWSVALLRYFNPIGAHESGLIGEDPVGIPNNLMPYITQVASGRLKQLSVFGDDYDTPDGTGVRDYIITAARSSIWAPAWATVCWTWSRLSKRPTALRFPIALLPAARAISPLAMPTRPRPRNCCTGRRKRPWKTCAATAGAGRKTTPTAIGTPDRLRPTPLACRGLRACGTAVRCPRPSVLRTLFGTQKGRSAETQTVLFICHFMPFSLVR